MRTPAMIGLAAAAGFALAWLLLTQMPQQPVPAAPAPIAPPAQPAPPPAPPVAVPAKAPEPPPPPKDDKPAPPPKVAQSTPPAAQTDEPADDETGEEGDQEGDAKPPIDTDHAADLIADLIARQETAAGDSGLPNPTAQTWKKFDQEEADPAWSEATTQQIEAALEQWINSLPQEVRDHTAVIHIECRTTMCQVLAADNDVETQNERSQAGQEWQQALALLPNQPWWNELGFTDMSTQVTADQGYMLYMTYLLREVKPPQ